MRVHRSFAMLAVMAMTCYAASAMANGAPDGESHSSYSFLSSRATAMVPAELAERLGAPRDAPNLAAVLKQVRNTDDTEIEYVGLLDDGVEVRIRAVGLEQFKTRMRSNRAGGKNCSGDGPCVPTDPAPGDTVTTTFEDYWNNSRWRVSYTWTWMFDDNLGRYRWVVTDAWVQYLGPWGYQIP
jgi:hypothetical protein